MKKSSKSQNNDENYIETKRQINKMSDQLHQELSKKYNPSNTTEGLKILSQSLAAKPGEQPIIEKVLSDAFKEFEQKTGRNMTYSEMRQMFG